MTDESEFEVEFLPENEVYLHDGQCWLRSADCLDPAAGFVGIGGARYSVDRGAEVLVLPSFRWVNVETFGKQGATVHSIQ